VDAKLVRELATGRFVPQAENLLIFGPPGVGKTHLAIALGRAVVECGHSVLFTSATGLVATLARRELLAEAEEEIGILRGSESKPEELNGHREGVRNSVARKSTLAVA